MKSKTLYQIGLSFTALLLIFSLFPVSSWGFGFIQGYVKNEADEAIEGAQIETEGASTTSYADGCYAIALSEGLYTVTASATGYQAQIVENVVVADDNPTSLDFTLIPVDLKIEAVYPTLGELGHNLEVNLIGQGFDENTRVSMYLDSGNKRRIISSIDTPGSAEGITVMGDKAYVADGFSGLQVVDISDPENPQIIGSVDTPGDSHEVTVIGDKAYVADRDSGLQLIDISNPLSPNIVGSVDTPDAAWGVAVINNIAYVAARDSGLQIIDVSNPSNPNIIGSVDTPDYAYGVAVIGDRAYVANRYSGLQVIDVSDPYNPTIIGSVYTPGHANSIAVVGSIAYVADWFSLQVIDVSNPYSPMVIAHVDTPGWADGITVIGSRAYVSDSESGLQVIDVSNPYDPKIIGAVDVPGSASGAEVRNNVAYVADGSGLQVIDVSNPSTPNIIGAVNTPSYASGIKMVGDTAYLANVNSGLQVIDLSDPYNPTIIGSVNTPGTAWGVTVIDNIAYVADRDSGLQIIDVSNPSNPNIIGSVDTPGEAMEVTVLEDTAYVADWYGGLQLIDVSDPYSPTIIGSVDTLGYGYDFYQGIFVIDNTAYMVGGTGLMIIDVSNPSNPTIIGSVDTPGSAVTVIDTTAYVAGGTILQVIDVSNPSNPIIIGSVDMMSGFLGRITMIGSTVYIANGGDGLIIIDVSSPSNPTIIGSVDTPGSAKEVVVIGDLAYVADYGSGLTVVPLPVEITPISINSPTNISIVLPSPQIPGHYTLRVFNSYENYELLGAVTFTENLQTLNSKAIIVAGGGPYAPGNIWEETKLCANKAYDVLVQQGFDHDSIYYLSMETGNDYVDKASLDFYLHDAIINWAGDGDTSELLLYFVDHGEPDHFILYADGDYSQKLSVQDLDEWLDDLQNGPMTGPVTLIYDACDSGSFVSKLRPPAERVRHIITSASNEPAYFLNHGIESFSFQFWNKILLNKGNLGTAFSNAENTMQGYQTALIETNGNGIANEDNDLSLAGNNVIKRGSPTYISVNPFVGSVSVGELSGFSAEISASGVVDADSVWAQIIPPDINPESSGVPITDLPVTELMDSDEDGVYTGVYNNQGDYDGFDKIGTYIIIVKAIKSQEVYSYVAGSMTTQAFYSPPLYTAVTQTSGIQNIEEDSYEEDDTFTQASVTFVNDVDTQSHNFHDVGDVDWVQFYGTSGNTYKIKASKLSVICDAVIEVYNADGTPIPEGPQNNGGAGEDEFIDWTCPQDGMYYVKISNFNDTFGENIKYDLSVYLPVAGVATVIGQVKDSSDKGVDGVRVASNIGSPIPYTYTYGGGYYSLTINSGDHILTATKTGFAPQQLPVNVQNENWLPNNNFVLPAEDTTPPTAFLNGAPSGIAALNTFEITVGGEDVVQYRYKLDNGVYSSTLDVGINIVLNGLTEGFHTLNVIGRDSANNWQTEIDATVVSWEIVCLGNINGDDEVDIADAIINLKVLADIETNGLIRSDYATSGADVNKDNEIGTEELIYILQKEAGMR